MMKQNPNAKMPSFSKDTINYDDISESELISMLTKKGKSALMNMNKKKEFVLDLHKLKSELVSDALAYDTVNGTALSNGIKNIIPHTKSEVTKMNNDGLSKVIAQLLLLLETIQKYLLVQY